MWKQIYIVGEKKDLKKGIQKCSGNDSTRHPSRHSFTSDGLERTANKSNGIVAIVLIMRYVSICRAAHQSKLVNCSLLLLQVFTRHWRRHGSSSVEYTVIVVMFVIVC